MDDLLAYIPEDRAFALVSGHQLPEHTHGSALFADISGFTPLTEALTQALGPRAGIETLTEQINAVYTALIAAVVQWRGSVISFAGDAITCWFDDTNGPATLRAAACGLALQAAMRPFAAIPIPGGRHTSLALKVAIATGPARRFVVGSPDVQLLDVLAGATLARMATGEHLARPGNILIDAASVVALRSSATLGEQRVDAASGECFTLLYALNASPEPCGWEPVRLAPDLVRPWVLPIVWAQHQVGLGDFLTELRSAVPLFLRFGGLDFDVDDNAGTQLDTLVRRVQAILTDTGGALLQISVGDKGAYLYATFGAPIAHEDDARRAARAALALHPIASELNLPPLQIGLSQGTLRCGAYGGSSRKTYGVLGDMVNVAARLMQAADPGTTLATDRVSSLAGNTLMWESQPALILKGKSEPIAVARLRDLRPDAQLHQRTILATRSMVGRHGELAQIEVALDHLATHHIGATFIIEGEPGIGKSQLAHAVLAEARQRQLRTLVGGSDAVEQRTSAFAWRTVFSQILGLDGLPDETHDTHVREQLRSLGEEAHAPLLNAVLSFHLPDTIETSRITGKVRADQTSALLLRLLRRCAEERPLVILLEDLQWFDPTSWELLHAVRQELPTLLLLTTRPPELDTYGEYGQLLTDPNIQWLNLSPLTPAEIVPLVCDRFGADQLAPEVADLILARADGNPYFSLELAAVLHETGMVRNEAGISTFAPGRQREAGVLPDTLQGVIGYRLDQLDPEPQLTLKVASVIGRVFATKTLHAIHPISLEAKQLYGHLRAVEQVNLVVQETPEPDLSYIFRHIIAQEVAYRLLPGALQRTLHGAVARWIEANHPNDRSPYYLLLAYHWEQAGESARAIAYREEAGAYSLLQGNFIEALEGFQLLQEQYTPADEQQRGRWLSGLAQAYSGLGDVERSIITTEQAVMILDQPMPTNPRSMAIAISIELLHQVGRRLLPRLPYYRIHTAEEWQQQMEVVLLYDRFVIAQAFGRGQLPLLAYVALRAVNLAEGTVPTPELIVIYGMLSVVCSVGFALNLFSPAEWYYARMRATYAQIDAPLMLSTALAFSTVGLQARGKWARSRVDSQEGFEIAKQFDLHGLMDYHLGMLAYCAYYTSHDNDDEHVMCALEQNAQQNEQNLLLLWMFHIRSGIANHQGRYQDAVTQAEASLTLAIQVESRVSQIIAYGMLALAHWELGDEEAADQASRCAHELIAVDPLVTAYYAYDGFFNLARVTLDRWAVASARGSDTRHLRRAAQKRCIFLWIFARFSPIGRPGLKLCVGWWHWLSGRHWWAKNSWHQAIDLAQQMEMPYEEALAHAALGQHLPQGSTQRQHHLATAVAIFNRIGAHTEVRRVIAVARSG